MCKQKLNTLWEALAMLICGACTSTSTGSEIGNETPFLWENANIYFLLTDRFLNGDPGNDLNFERSDECAVMRGFQGGDITGDIQKLEEGYFDELGITALWLTPWLEQNHGNTFEEGSELHDYYSKRYTSVSKGKITLDSDFGIILPGNK